MPTRLLKNRLTPTPVLAAALVLVVALCLPWGAQASVVDAAKAEQLYQAGDYKEARAELERLIEDFRQANKDSSDWRVYREAAYLYDRLADCCFTQRDWPKLKECVDGLLVVSTSERNLLESQLSGALASGIAYATAKLLGQRLDESVRLTILVQLKRSIGLILLDTGGSGTAGEGAIKQYQQLAAAFREVVAVDGGAYALNVPVLEKNVGKFDEIYQAVAQLTDLTKLWEKYPPEGSPKEAAGGK